jgi:hypothetical protein
MKSVSRSLAALISAVIAITFLATTAMADDDRDPPGRVARISYMSGEVSFQPGGVKDWVDATLNRPLTTADRVWTDKNSKAELQLGTAAIRMNSETSLTITNLTDNTVQLDLYQGVLNVHVVRMYDGEIYEVDTPNVAFTLLKPGDYRFEVDPDHDTTAVIVRKGKGEGNGDGRGVEVNAGEMARFEHGNTLMHAIMRAPSPDGFDDWCRVRDKREDRGYESARYVSPDVIGYDDLDEYGYWRPMPTYGYVWFPRHVVVGWAPYRYGHWVWIDPWGWTWIDDAPWGFAPFHYGRWVYSPYGWGWCPGPRIYRPVYAPALVAWIGGANWGVGLGFGNVGWVPLGWGEPYYPYYRASRVYVQNINIRNTHITNINYVTNNYTNIINNHGKPMPLPVHYMNERGVSVVPKDAMIRSERVDRVAHGWQGKDFRKAEFLGSPGVTPDRRSVLGPGKPTQVPQNFADRRPVVTKLTPPARPTSFEERRPFIEKNNDMPVGRTLNANAARVPDNRAPVGTGEGSTGPRGGNRADSANPAVPHPPAERQPNAGRQPNNAGEAGNGAGAGHMVPRPPSDRQPAGIGNDSPAGRGAAVDTPRHEVPRPPADRGNGNGNYGRTGQNPSVERNAGSNGSGERNAVPNTPQERRPVDAQSRPVARPPERENRPAYQQRQNHEQKQTPSREEKSKPSERESRAQSGFTASNRYNVPRPTAANPSRPASAYGGRYANASYGGGSASRSSYGYDRGNYGRSYRGEVSRGNSGYDRGWYGNSSSRREPGYNRGYTGGDPYRGGSGYQQRSYSRGSSNVRDYGNGGGYSARSYGGGRSEMRSGGGGYARGYSGGGGESRAASGRSSGGSSRSSGGSWHKGR